MQIAMNSAITSPVKAAARKNEMDDVVLQGLIRLVAQARDREAFGRLFDHIAPRIRSHLLRVGVPASECDDVVQEVMVNIWVKAGLYQPDKGSLMAWVYVMARNLRIDRLRKARPQLYLSLDGWDEPDDVESAEDSLVRSGSVESLQRAMADLPPEQREIYNLVFREELSQSEIAKRLSLPLGTVKSRMRLAMVFLRRKLEFMQ